MKTLLLGICSVTIMLSIFIIVHESKYAQLAACFMGGIAIVAIVEIVQDNIRLYVRDLTK